MKRVEVIQEESMDVTMFWIFEQKESVARRLVGVNFHCGTDCIDDSYAKPDELLTKLYCKLAARSNRLKEAILKDAINEWMIITDEASRRTVIDNQIDYMFEVLMERVVERTFHNGRRYDEKEEYVEKSIKEALAVFLTSYTGK
jgi:hypothetical protein